MNLSKLLFVPFLFLADQNLQDIPATTAPAPSSPCSISNNVFKHGEKIVYKVYYNLGFVWISAGEVVFQVEEQDQYYHISAFGRTYKSYDWVFKVRDYYDSYLDKKTLRPVRTVRKVLEGKYTAYDEVTYQHDRNTAISFKGKSRESANTQQVSLVQCTHDILSSVYSLRNQDFKKMIKGSQFPVNIYLDRKIYDLQVIYAGDEEEKRIKGLGQCGAMLFRPQLVVGNVFKDNEGMKIWVSNDDNKIPLMIESPISVGSVKVVLHSHSGLKYPASY